jgi:hypothetical protein
MSIHRLLLTTSYPFSAWTTVPFLSSVDRTAIELPSSGLRSLSGTHIVVAHRPVGIQLHPRRASRSVV